MLDVLQIIPMEGLIDSAKDTIGDVRGVVIAAVGLVCIIIVLGAAWASKGAIGTIVKVGFACALVFGLCAGGIVALGGGAKKEIETRTGNGDIIIMNGPVVPNGR